MKRSSVPKKGSENRTSFPPKLSIVIDAQVVNDKTILDLAHKRKAEYYSANARLRRSIAAKRGTEEVQFPSATLFLRGLWIARSAKGLLKSGFINKSDLKVISSRVLVGRGAAWNVLNRRTSAKKSHLSNRQFERTGVG